MKKRLFSIAAMLLLAFVLVSVTATEAKAVEVILTGDITRTDNEDNDVDFVLYDDGKLVISGSGDMEDYPSWRGYDDSIKTVVIEYGVTNIGEWAFDYCDSLTTVEIAAIPPARSTISAQHWDMTTRLPSRSLPAQKEVIQPMPVPAA